jgi:hypothetical protein
LAGLEFSPLTPCPGGMEASVCWGWGWGLARVEGESLRDSMQLYEAGVGPPSLFLGSERFLSSAPSSHISKLLAVSSLVLQLCGSSPNCRRDLFSVRAAHSTPLHIAPPSLHPFPKKVSLVSRFCPDSSSKRNACFREPRATKYCNSYLLQEI